MPANGLVPCPSVKTVLGADTDAHRTLLDLVIVNEEDVSYQNCELFKLMILN